MALLIWGCRHEPLRSRLFSVTYVAGDRKQRLAEPRGDCLRRWASPVRRSFCPESRRRSAASELASRMRSEACSSGPERRSSARPAFPVSPKAALTQMLISRIWSGTTSAGAKTIVPPGLSAALQPSGVRKQKHRGHQSRRIAPGVLAAAENSVRVNVGRIYGWDGTLHRHYRQPCSRGRVRGHVWGSEERKNHLRSWDCSVIAAAAYRFPTVV